LLANAVPRSFGDGLVEYFLGVERETNGDGGFSQRLEVAFMLLKRFAPFSDIAALITEYFRYRMNTFVAQNTAMNRLTRPLAWIRHFFLRNEPASSGNSSLKSRIELVVPQMEYCCMQAVDAMMRADESGALGMISLSRKLSGSLLDPQREDRLRLIEARAYARMGELNKAHTAYRNLITSPCPLFQGEAVAFLKQ